jgi:signal transduction histidine kinase
MGWARQGGNAMRLVCLVLLLLPAGLWGQTSWLDIFSPELRGAKRELVEAQAQLRAMGEPMVGNTVDELGAQHTMLEAPPPASPFVQVDLGESRQFDTVVLIPAAVDYQSARQTPYAFPLRYRLDTSDFKNFSSFTTLHVRAEQDHHLGRVAPIVVKVNQRGLARRFVRLTVTKLAEVEGRWTFALGEMMVLSGNRNLALGAPVAMKGGAALPPRWRADYLTDGRTCLGPPIDVTAKPEYDAVFASVHKGVMEPWMMVDLGRVMPVQELRLHPLHARQGADVPGFAFPLRFRAELSLTEDFLFPTVVYSSSENFSGPGNNPVTLAAGGQLARYARVVMTQPRIPARASFALSELELYSRNQNVALGKQVTTSGDERDAERPPSMLTDGMASYGKLMGLGQWIEYWRLRTDALGKVDRLTGQIPVLSEKAESRAVRVLVVGAVAILGLMAVLFWSAYRRQTLEQQEFRDRLARDMHDEIGSNLAGIATLSELAAREGGTQEDWGEIHQISRETNDALREVLWLSGARQESGIDLLEHLDRAARRLLPQQKLEWLARDGELSHRLSQQQRRQVFLFFKEALNNIARHAGAKTVQLAARWGGAGAEFMLKDDGRGFDAQAASTGVGLRSLRARADELRGELRISSSPEAGTVLTLTIPTS